MCGRATLISPVEHVAELFDVAPIDIGPRRFNIAPSQPVLVVRSSGAQPGHEPTARPAGASASAPRELALLRWGLIPSWAHPDEAKKMASRFAQARAETAARSPAFRDAFRRHRCLVVVDGFFEWKTLSDGRRAPHHVRRRGGEPFAIAGIWDSWPPPRRAAAEPALEHVESCAVITTSSAGELLAVHDRMPLVLPAEDWSVWLSASAAQAATLLDPGASALERRSRELVLVPVSTWVNDVRHDDPRCVEPSPIAPEPPIVQLDLPFAGRR